MSDKHTMNRRKFLKSTGVVTGAAATLGIVSVSSGTAAAAPAHEAEKAVSHAEANSKPLHRGRMFFTNDTEFSTLAAAAERIFPKDELGPGAIELAVPYFIDNQLAGGWGYNVREYVVGPHFVGAPTQGYQTALLRRDAFKIGLRALNEHAQTKFKKNFSRLGGDEQDQVLTDCEAGTITMSGFSSQYFFGILRDAVIAGVYADPMYNGNNNMDGWRMKQYPGAQMAYSYLMTEETFQEIEPVSLASMQ